MTTNLQGMLETALANPWATLEHVLDGPLHPGGREATAALLDRAEVTADTRLLDVGCGAGAAAPLARERGARVVGLDHDPPTGGVRGDAAHLPVRDGAVDVALSECVMCLVDDRERAFAEVARALGPDGRLALSDMVVAGETPDIPPAIDRAVCLSNAPTQSELVATIEDAGFRVDGVTDHHEELLATRDQVKSRVDYERLLGLLGERGQEILAAIEDVEAAVETERIGYVSLVAHAEG